MPAQDDVVLVYLDRVQVPALPYAFRHVGDCFLVVTWIVAIRDQVFNFYLYELFFYHLFSVLLPLLLWFMPSQLFYFNSRGLRNI